ncbi:MAG: SIR2 family protein [Dehalococcoidia bacterium]
MNIPQALLDEIRNGNAVLFLGAGASIGSKNNKGGTLPSSKDLTKLISNKFLGSNYVDYSLSAIAELAISESSLFEVQEFIKNIYYDFQPANFHGLIPTFRWHGIATTNFDLIIERTYEKAEHKLQTVVPFIKNQDRIDQLLTLKTSIALIKLHGCITYINDPNVQLILHADQYITHRNGRQRLFNMVTDWGYEHPIIFVGHSLSDPDIREMLLELGNQNTRPRYYTVSPTLTDAEQRMWEQKRISSLLGTFEDFLKSINSGIPSSFRPVTILSATAELPISKHLVVPINSLSESCLSFLDNDVDYVTNNMQTPTIDPRLFYKGFSGGWSAIDQNLDVRRGIVDTILSDVILSENSSSKFSCGLYLLKGHAGSGKSVLLRRIAFEAATSFGKLCLFKKQLGHLRFEPIAELAQATKEHIFLFVDKISENVSEIQNIITRCRTNKLSLTIIATERPNEWNISCTDLDLFVSDEYEVGNLTPQEIDKLLELLDRHHSLGTLQKMALAERRRAFLQVAQRQLLVALHEATMGKPFEDIIADEYEGIRPDKAQSIYLAICILNQFDVPVRSGVISRVFGIRFTDFMSELFQPLEQVVNFEYDSHCRDNVYMSRHPRIAQIIFDRILSVPVQRLDKCIQLLNCLNIDYYTDRVAYRKLIRAKPLLDFFAEHEMIEAIYEAADRIAHDDHYLYHQRAIYEINRPNGNLRKAADYLKTANSLAPNDRTILHSMAELELKMAEKTIFVIEQEAHLREAKKLINRLIQTKDPEPYPFHTLVKICLTKLKMILVTKEETGSIAFNDAIVSIETALQEGLQRFPGDPYLLDAESEYSKLITDESRSIDALSKAFKSNPHNSYIAVRLAKSLIDLDRKNEAIDVYKIGIKSDPDNKNLNYQYARLLIDQPDSDNQELEYLLRRSFTEGDRNYDAQFWYARQLYINSKYSDSRERFNKLRNCAMDPITKRRVRGIIISNNIPVSYRGRITKLESSYCYITRDEIGDSIYVDRKHLTKEMQDKLSYNMRVKFTLGFTFYGAAAAKIESE